VFYREGENVVSPLRLFFIQSRGQKCGFAPTVVIVQSRGQKRGFAPTVVIVQSRGQKRGFAPTIVYLFFTMLL
jgi:hypothetical protein